VEIEPATDWRSMSPRFSNATPYSSRSRLSAPSTIPPSTLNRPDARSKSSIRMSRSRRTMTPSVSAMSVNECPDADARTGCPRPAAAATASWSSDSDAGVEIEAGRHR